MLQELVHIVTIHRTSDQSLFGPFMGESYNRSLTLFSGTNFHLDASCECWFTAVKLQDVERISSCWTLSHASCQSWKQHIRQTGRTPKTLFSCKILFFQVDHNIYNVVTIFKVTRCYKNWLILSKFTEHVFRPFKAIHGRIILQVKDSILWHQFSSGCFLWMLVHCCKVTRCYINWFMLNIMSCFKPDLKTALSADW